MEIINTKFHAKQTFGFLENCLKNERNKLDFEMCIKKGPKPLIIKTI